MKKRFLVLSLLLLAAGCAEVVKMAPAFVGKFLTVSLDPGVPFPAELTLEGFDNTDAGKLGGVLGTVFQQATGESLKKKASALIAANTAPYGVALTNAMRDEIKRRDLYAGVVDKGGNVGMRIAVARYGLKATNGLKELKPLLDVKGEIVVPGFGVVWSKTYAVDEKTAQTLGLSAVQLLGGTASFQKAFESAAQAAAQGLLAELK